MERQHEESVEWIIREAEQDESNEARYPDYKEKFPYEVVLVDQFQGHCEYGYDKVCRYSSMEEAITSARKITENSLLVAGSVESWHGMGDAGLVYDQEGKLVWDGVREYTDFSGSPEVFKAIEFATKAHSEHFRKKTNIPYIVHPLKAAQALMEVNCPNKIVIACLLHDTIEDTDIKYCDIEQNFGRYVAELVKQASEPDKKASWKARKAHAIETLQKASSDAALVACADKLDNIKSMKREYEKIGERVWEKFNASKDDQKWYYDSLAEVFSRFAKEGAYAPIFSEFVSEATDEAYLNMFM